MALVGTYVGLSPALVATFPVLLLSWLRFGIGAMAMAGWLAPRPGDGRLTPREHLLLFLQSLLGNFLFTVCMLKGAALTGSVTAGVAMAAIPAAVVLLSRVFLGEGISARVWLAVACSAGAVTLLALERAAASLGTTHLAQADGVTGVSWANHLWGPALLVAAVLCEASYMVIGKRLSASVSPTRVSAIINLWGLVLSTPLGLAAALDFDFQAVRPSIWGLLVFYAITASMVTVWLWMKGMRHVPAQRAGVFAVFLPLSAAAVGVLVLSEPWGAAHGVALALAILAVVLVTRNGAPATSNR